jgi:hypothetical protein
MFFLYFSEMSHWVPQHLDVKHVAKRGTGIIVIHYILLIISTTEFGMQL